MGENENKINNENNIIKVTNNNVKYYENLALQHSKESAKSATKSAGYANDAKSYMNSCQLLKNTIDDETVQIVKLHSDNTDNPHNVTASQVDAYSKSELDSLLEEKLVKKNQKLIAGENIVITDNDDGSQTIKSANTVSLNYELTENKPSINEIVLSGNKSSYDLGLASIDDIPTCVSELENDSGYLTTHQDITGKQDVISAGDGIIITENVVSTVNRADNDLSNLSNLGKKVIDGAWVSNVYELSSATAKGTYTVDLSEYLPDSSSDYEVYIIGRWGAGLTASDGTIIGGVIKSISGVETSLSFAAARGTDVQGYSLVIPIGKENQTFTYERTNGKGANFGMYAYAYRRIGTNE